MKYIASLSFGKDSLAMLVKIKELGLPLDEVIYCDIRYSNKISGEMPKMAAWIPTAEKILQDKFGIKVTHLTAKKTFYEQFLTIKQKGNHVGDRYGFPYLAGAWCNDRLKMQPIRNYKKQFKESITVYTGIAYDEYERYQRLVAKNTEREINVCPLVDLKITEREAMEICRKNNLLSPIYNDSFRGGCWFCPKQSNAQLYNLYMNYPKYWAELKRIEPLSHNTFKPGVTLTDLEKQFEIKKQQINFWEAV